MSPALSAGVPGYAEGLRALVLAHASETTLMRMTFFRRTSARQLQWVFGGFVRRGANFVAMSVPGAGVAEQTVNLPIGGGGRVSYVVTPLAAAPEDLATVLDEERFLAAAPAERGAGPCGRCCACRARSPTPPRRCSASRATSPPSSSGSGRSSTPSTWSAQRSATPPPTTSR